jgi:glycosidase
VKCALAGVVVLAVAFAACNDAKAPSVPERSCALTIWYKATTDAAHVEVIGSWDGWARPGRTLDGGRADGWRVAQYDLPAGPVQYAIIDDGVWIADPNVPTSAWHEGNEVAWVNVASCDAPAIRVDDARGSPDGRGAIAATFLAAKSGAALDPASITVASATASAAPTPTVTSDPRAGTISLAFDALPPGKHAMLVRANDAHGASAETRATIWIEPRPFDPRDAVIYQVIVDRYRDSSGAPLAAPAIASARAGGHVAGVRRALESGALAAIGVNTLWLSPLYANPSSTWPGADGRPYSSYHGYWPIAARALEPTIADEASLDALVAAAHARGVRVLFDVVPNHVHVEHPYWAARTSDAWFNHSDGKCVCGNPDCDWSTHILDCWFTPYLPDLDWRNLEVADRVSDDVAWWMDRFDADGVRIDAVPMMPRSATRRIAYEIRTRFDHPGNKSFLLGENFTGPGGYDLLRYELGPFGLDSEFHFPLLWALRGAIAQQTATLVDLDAAIVTGETDWRGSGAVMGLTIGNHDVARFASVSAGDGNGDPWTPALQPTDDLVYAKQRLALGLTFALPGAPVVYYGDEVALAGHADPDARRVMPADDAITAQQKATRDFVARAAKVRACSAALRYGTYRTLAVDAEHLAFARETNGDVAVVVVQRAGAAPFSAPLPSVAAGDWTDALGGANASLRPELTNLPAAAFSLQIFFPAGSSCAK